MKKFFTLIISLAMVAGVSAQDTTEPTEYPHWTLTVKRTDIEPNGDGDIYTMTRSGATNNGQEVYTVTAPLEVKGNNIKPAKYWFTISYDDGNGTTKTLGLKNAFLLNQNDTFEDVTVGAYFYKNNIQALYSVFNYSIGDAKWRILTEFPCNDDGSPSTVYFNAGYDNTNLKAFQNINATTSCDNFLSASSTVAAPSLSATKINPGIYKATLDYATTLISIEKVDEIEIVLRSYVARTFVAPADVTIPEGVDVYTLAYETETNAENETETPLLRAVSFKESTLPANTPVVLRSKEHGTYSFAVTSDPVYDIDVNESDASQKYIKNVEVENGLLTGVLQPHYLPEGCYAFDNTKCTEWLAADHTDAKGVVTHTTIPQFSAYLTLPADVEPTTELPVKYPEPIPTGVENVTSYTQASQTSATFNLMGQPVDASYKGIVIRDGKKYIQR